MSNFDNPYASSSSPSDIGPAYGNIAPQSGMALTSMILGIGSLVTVIPSCCCFVFSGLSGLLGVGALILGYLGMQECQTQGKRGKEMAMAGMICGGIGLALSILLIVLSVLGIAVRAGANNGLNRQNF
ncbi:MAG TPA: DUF4190 domain-containing protein [Pirellulaceae bacterium]|nr:DUF4190 domain-containing protein [Pirellulaceae bacterium]